MKPHPQIEHTPEISSRRRALFPDSSPCDDDLGCISPLDFDEGCAKNVFSLDTCVGDYDIIGLVEKGHTVHTPNNTNTTTKVITPCTTNESPTQKLKTPHDTHTNTVFPKLIRNKTQVDTAPNQDCKNPKVRTALFPDKDMSLPSRNFYPKTDNEVLPRPFALTKKPSPEKTHRRKTYFLCNKRSKFSRSGQINAGVSHKIKKRKIRKISKIAALEAAINIIENSPLNAIFDSVVSNSESVEAAPECIQTAPEAAPCCPTPSPTPSPEPDPSKRFFKSSRHKAVVTVNPNIKLEMNNGRISLIQNKNPLKRVRVQEGVSPKRPKLDFEPEQPLIPTDEISNIINSLEDKENERKNPDLLMSPTSQMCNMTSGLALNSPKKARDLSSVLDAMPSNEKKFFPIFYPGKTVFPSPVKEHKVSNGTKKFRPISKDQMLLDAGQKRWGATQCPECKIIYHMGDPGDEIMHLNYHNAGHIFRFNGWKNERVVSNDLRNGKIIQIIPGDSKIWWKKVKDVMEVVNRDLGYFDIEFNTANSQIFFYVKSKVIIGALVAEVKTTAHKLLTTHQDQVDLCSEESYPVKCGVSRIWVAHNHRQKGVATSLMDALKRNFVFGAILRNEDIAFSSPTEEGKIFGAKYFKTPNFLIYFV
ncbi:N-acetyltransferase ESCO2 [Tribolium madens]|uniref:N-acetyltransferase ESCO2 n=1 Tax=Tribolium madens TaxID=41895 RepID=UPI001CF73184|nr:N-acetyltransferase ESCO2 [Tribolium madens]